jgi:required for meiotic nuclear division protein 1
MELPEIFLVRALLVARRIRLRRFPVESATALNPLLFAQGEQGYVALFRYGVAVFINVSPLEQQHLIDETLRSYLEEPIETGEEESIEVIITPDQDERVQGEKITLHESSMPRLQILAEVMARSVFLADYESRINHSFDMVEPLALKLSRSWGPWTSSQLLQTIGTALASEHDMVGRAVVTEKPDLLWEHFELEGFYLMLENDFELRERDTSLVRKINLVSRTAQTSLELLHSRRSLRVEWYIVILIIVEILLTLFELFIRNH